MLVTTFEGDLQERAGFKPVSMPQNHLSISLRKKKQAERRKATPRTKARVIGVSLMKLVNCIGMLYGNYGGEHTPEGLYGNCD